MQWAKPRQIDFVIKMQRQNCYSAACALLLCFQVLSILSTNGLPLPTEENDELVGGDFEGDIILTEEQRALLTAPADPKARNGLRSEYYRWPSGIVLYKISAGFPAGDVARIKHAMAVISSRSCIRFAAAPPDARAYISIERPTSGCSSYVGYHGRVLPVHLSRGCMRTGTIQHELLHAIGFYHQQSDPNRDHYVSIQLQNVRPGHEHNFKKYSAGFVSDFGVGYDYGSVMHYGEFSFSRNGSPTILPLDKNAKIGQRNGLSDGDFLKLNRMYGC